MFGGVRARLDGIFDAKVFVVSFVSNVVVAALIVFLGDKLGVGGQLSTAVVVVLGIRIFGNAAAIRRQLFRATSELTSAPPTTPDAIEPEDAPDRDAAERDPSQATMRGVQATNRSRGVYTSGPAC